MIRKCMFVSAAVAVLCIAALTVDYAIEVRRTPSDDARMAALQEQVRSDASKATVLNAERGRVTDARRSRRARASGLAWVLIAAVGGFLVSANVLLPAVKPKKVVRAK